MIKMLIICLSIIVIYAGVVMAYTLHNSNIYHAILYSSDTEEVVGTSRILLPTNDALLLPTGDYILLSE
jgi:hypothetical protein